MGDFLERLKTAPESSVRAVLVALCNDSSAERKAMEFLDAVESLGEPQEQEMGEHGEDGGENEDTVASSSSSSSKPSRKRKAEHEIKICVQCEDAFYEHENSDMACQFHKGDLEPDYDADIWADHDEDCHGIIDTPEMQEENPEGFVWTCCDKIGTAAGCTHGPHQAAYASRGVYYAR